jgi:hypothetical protein
MKKEFFFFVLTLKSIIFFGNKEMKSNVPRVKKTEKGYELNLAIMFKN